MNEIVSIEYITCLIYLIRGKNVMLDRDIAELYGVETKRLKEQVRRNIERFPVRTIQVRVYKLEVAICDLQSR